MNHIPPKIPLKFFRWFCHTDFQEDIEGDLVERYLQKIDEKGVRYAKWYLWLEVLRLFRPSMINWSHKRLIPASGSMLMSYCKVSWRNILRFRLNSFINIAGLTLGITCFLLIFLYVDHELSYDKHFADADRIYRVYTKENSGDQELGSSSYATTPLPLADAMKAELPEIEALTSIRDQEVLIVTETNSTLEKGLWVDSQFFQVFDFVLLQGNPSKVLTEPNSIVITSALASKMFADENAIGKSLTVQVRKQKRVFNITGVLANPPEQTTLKFEFLAPIEQYTHYRNNWDTSDSHTFITLQHSAGVEDVEAKIPDLLKKYRDEDFWTEYRQEEFKLQPLADLHLSNHINEDIGLKGSNTHINVLSMVAILTLILACVNYMNLAIARSLTRSKEVGVRKVIGAGRGQLMIQFLAESWFFSLLAMLLSVGLVYWLLPVFSALLERSLVFNPFNEEVIPIMVIIVAIIGLISGSYPAFFMSSLKTSSVLKGQVASNRPSGLNLKDVLVIGQYAISVIMIIGSLVIYSQFQYLLDKDVGYNRERILVISITDFPSHDRFESLKAKWLMNPHVAAVAASWQLPTSITSNGYVEYEGHDAENPKVLHRTSVTEDFLEVYGLELLAGDGLGVSINDPSGILVLNESALKSLGWTAEDAIGKRIEHRGMVVGIIKDFHMLSLHHDIEPLMVRRSDRAMYRYISIKLKPSSLSNMQATLKAIDEDVSANSDFPFEYQFLDDKYQQLYASELRMSKLLNMFTILSILIASLGLFGLSAFNVFQRTKEIAIRKVLGASAITVISLISRSYLGLVLVGFLVASPIAWYLANQWLQDFVFRVSINWWVFAFAGLATAVTTLLTVSSHSIRASLANPAHSLRDD